MQREPGFRTKRQSTAVVLLLAGAVFGIALTAGLSSTDTGLAAPEPGPVQVAESASNGLPDFADLAEAVRPAVVSIRTSRIETSPHRGAFDFFFGPRRDAPRREEEEDSPGFRQDSTGSGFVISADGLVITNNHVVAEAEKVVVILGGREYEAEVRGTDEPTDIALLKIEAPESLPHLKLGDSEELRVGEWIMAVGSPLELAQTVTVGVVSAKGRSLGVLESSFENFIQTDAAINFGNSGGPLLNVRGEVVGIATLINWGAENIGFAVPVDTLEQILPQLEEAGRVSRGYLGIRIEDVTYDVAQAFGLDQPQGVLVNEVIPGQPADEAGLRHGDIVLEVDGSEVGGSRFLIDYVSVKGPGESVELTLVRDDERITRTVHLTERPAEGGAEVETEPSAEEGGIEWLGVRYQDLTSSARRMHGIPEDVDGIWITDVEPTSPLWEEGVRNDGILYVATEVNGHRVTDVGEFEAVVREAPAGLRLRLYLRLFHRGEELPPRFVFPQVPR